MSEGLISLRGLVNAFFSDAGLKMPHWFLADGVRIWKPGWIGNVIVGLFTALFSWAFYGPLSAYVVIGKPPPTQPDAVLSLGALAMAFLAGVGGARVLSSYVDKELFRAAAVIVMNKLNKPEEAKQIAMGRAVDAVHIAHNI